MALLEKAISTFFFMFFLFCFNESDSKELDGSKKTIDIINILNQEDKILNTQHDVSNDTWIISVLDNGSDRHGYALYVCEVLSEHNIVVSQKTGVHIVGFDNIEEVSSSAILGTANCSTYERVDP